ncbi:Acyltransferase 3 domain-containing protein [Aphelenchoides fujianensis]|nr:Acyltransferase 3 domain-containing protein [Aphelenchoides fujianensis]
MRSNTPALLLFACLLGLLAVWIARADHILSYSEDQVWSYLRNVQEANVSAACASSLAHVIPYLSANSTLALQRRLFFESYAVGEARQFISRDLDRWFYRALECLRTAGDTTFSASEYPAAYCYAMDKEKKDLAYAICIPTPCENDRPVLLNAWQSVISHETAKARRWIYGLAVHPVETHDPMVQPTSAHVPLQRRLHSFDHPWSLQPSTISKKGGKFTSTRGRLLAAFSWTGNLKKLVRMPKDVNSTITCMFGLRFLCMCWTVIGHSFYIFQSFVLNVEEFRTELIDNFWNQWITNFTLSVDVFFVLSGTLTAYSWFKKWDGVENAPGFTSFAYWLRFYRHRVVRLWPALIYTLFTLITRLSWTHYHPMWPPTDPAQQCEKNGNWLKNVFMINSISGSMCMPLDVFIFYLFAPVFLIAIQRKATYGFNFSFLVILLSCLSNTYTMYVYDFPPTPLSWKLPPLFNQDFLLHHFVLYVKPWHRIGPYIASGRSSACTPHFKGWDWTGYHLFYGSFYRVVFALATSWVIYACHTGQAGVINWCLSMRVLLPLSSLSYSVYLIHFIPITFTYLLEDFPIVYTSQWPLFAHCVVQIIISYAMGARTALVAEIPAMNIERVLLTRKKSQEAFKPVPT